MGKLMNKLDSPVTYIILGVMALSLFFYGRFLMSQASKVSEYEPRGDYNWDINALSKNNSPINFKEFRINYHFSEEDGTLSFIPRDHLDKLIVFFPEPLKENVSVRINENNSWEQLQVTMPPHKQGEDKATIIFNGNNTDKWIIVDFKMDLSPNAEFDISKNSYWSDGQIYFTFGKEFECLRENCAFEIVHLKEVRRNVPEVNSMRLQMVNQTPIGSHLHLFETSARSLKVINTKSFKISMGASLMAGAIFSGFSIIISIIQHPKKKWKKIKNKWWLFFKRL